MLRSNSPSHSTEPKQKTDDHCLKNSFGTRHSQLTGAPWRSAAITLALLVVHSALILESMNLDPILNEKAVAWFSQVLSSIPCPRFQQVSNPTYIRPVGSNGGVIQCETLLDIENDGAQASSENRSEHTAIFRWHQQPFSSFQDFTFYVCHIVEGGISTWTYGPAADTAGWVLSACEELIRGPYSFFHGAHSIVFDGKVAIVDVNCRVALDLFYCLMAASLLPLGLGGVCFSLF